MLKKAISENSATNTKKKSDKSGKLKRISLGKKNKQHKKYSQRAISRIPKS